MKKPIEPVLPDDKWYTLDIYGVLDGPCKDREDAQQFARLRTGAFPERGPYRAVQVQLARQPQGGEDE